MKPTIALCLLALSLTACVPDCDEDQLYEAGYAMGVLCEDWITLWDESDGQCAADALGDGYNAARAESDGDCDASATAEPAPLDMGAEARD
jgi:hypothetical protein